MDQPAYFTPKSVEEAISLLSDFGEKAEVIAGGTDLLVRMKKGDNLSGTVISIDGLQGLDYIKEDGEGGILIGSRTSMRSIAGSALIREKCGVLASAASMVGTPTIRNHATIGGNLCNAAPSADTAPALIVLGAQVKIQGGNGEKTVPVQDFFTGPGQTVLGRSEILVEIQIPCPRTGTRAVYLKQTRSHGADLALVGVAVLVEKDGDRVKQARIALGAVAPTPIRAGKAEEVLQGKSPDEKLMEECAEAALLEASPIDDVRSSADYRKKLIKVLVKRGVKQVMDSEE